MPKPSDYTPARRYVMQAIMTLILGACVALAAAVSSRAQRANRVELAPDSVTAKDVTIRLPQGWRTQTSTKDPALVVEATEDPPADENDDDAEPRTLTVRVERLPAPLSPLQYLFTNFELPISGPRQRRMPEDWLVPIPMAGRDGVMMTAERGSRRRGSTIRKEVVATAVLPSQRAVIVHLQGIGEADANDHAIVRQVAAEMSLAKEPALGKPGDVVTLIDGIRFNAPRMFAPVPETDPQRTDRRLWLAAAPGKKLEELESRWQSIEAVGCLCPDFDPSDAQQAERAKSTLATLLLVRDAQWRGATVAPLDKRVWRADPPRREGGGDGLPARAFLMTHPSGRALLAIIRGGIGQDDFDGPWREIAPTIQFLPAADVASLEDVGTAEASRLRRAGYEKLLADRDLAWWLWTSHDAYVGWSSIDFPGGGGALAGKKQAHVRLSIGERVSHVTHDFSYDDESPQYTSTVAREQADPDTRVKTVQKTTLAAGKLSMSFQSGDRDEVQLWNAESAPPQFVPGALLPLVLGQLSRDPMLLVTDSFPGREGIGPPRPLTLIIRPGDDATATTAMTATTATTRAAAAGESTPMRSVTVQVNGTGSISRWYFRNTGELERVDWSGGVQQLASDENAVKHNFPKGDPLAP